MPEFNPLEPYNDLPLLPPEFNFDDIQILKKVNKANIALSRLSGEAKSIPNRDVLIEPLSFREAVASSEIENINTTLDEAFEAAIINVEELKKEQKETRNYRTALLAGYEMIKKNGFLNTNSFIEIQSFLVPDKPGIRKLPGVTIGNNATGETFYTPPVGEDVIRELLANFENYFNDAETDPDPLVKMAVMHYQFESIHPFYDGNGRTGRILMVLYLSLVKRLELPILFISGYINRNKSEYYRLLREVTTAGSWKEWVLFILSAVEEQAENSSLAVEGIRGLMQKYREEISGRKPKIYSAELVEYLFSYPIYSQSRMMEKLGISSRNTAAKYFGELIELGLIQEKKYKKEKVYFCPEFHELLS